MTQILCHTKILRNDSVIVSDKAIVVREIRYHSNIVSDIDIKKWLRFCLRHRHWDMARRLSQSNHCFEIVTIKSLFPAWFALQYVLLQCANDTCRALLQCVGLMFSTVAVCLRHTHCCSARHVYSPVDVQHCCSVCVIYAEHCCSVYMEHCCSVCVT